jgi:hypothetical protein
MIPMTRSLRYIPLILLAVHAAPAQVASGTVAGSVHDSSDAAVVDAKVVITQPATGEKRETVTNDRGEFDAPYMHIGEYEVTATQQGFRTSRMAGIFCKSARR